MIGRLRGTAEEIGQETCIIDVGGVGYLVHSPASTLARLVEGEAATLQIETHVREDMIRLYGFLEAAEKEWFALLMAHVQGVGARIAMSLLSALGTQGLAGAVATGDIATLCKAQGVGKKVAERIAAELKGKAPVADHGPEAHAPQAAEAIGALTALGYPKATAADAVAGAIKELGSEAESATIIRAALKRAAAA